MALNARKKIMAERDAQGYTPRFRMLCYQIFLKERSIPGVQRGLARRGYKGPKIPTPQTLSAWRDQENWIDTLRRQDEASIELDDDLEAGPLGAILERAQKNVIEIKQDLEKIRAAKEQRPSDLSQLWHAYNRALHILAIIAKLKTEADRESTEATPVIVIMNALKKVPRLRKFFEDREILIEIENSISAEMMEYTQRAIGITG